MMRGRNHDWPAAVAILRERDAVLGGIIDRVGEFALVFEPEAFPALARAIIHQQVSIKAGATITRRFAALYGEDDLPSPEQVLATPVEILRSAGLSGRKASYLLDLAGKFASGEIEAAALAEMSDEAVVERLVTVKGIGRWTAEMFLIFSLGRPNVLPVADLGLRRAVQGRYRIAEAAVEDEIRALGRLWEPHCTVAVWYLWRSLEAGQN